MLQAGVVVDLAPSVDAFVHVSELEDRFVSDASTLFSPGDVMDVLVLRPDRGSLRCSRHVLVKSSLLSLSKMSPSPAHRICAAAPSFIGGRLCERREHAVLAR